MTCWASGREGTPRQPCSTRPGRRAGSSASEPAAGPTTTGADREKGAGLFGTIAGVTVFLAFLTVAVQILMNLYSASVVTTAAYDAARQVAAEGERPPFDDGAEVQAEAYARSLLGGLAEDTEFTWIEDDPSVVQLRVVTRSPRFLLPVVDGALGLDVIDRTVTVRLEELQE